MNTISKMIGMLCVSAACVSFEASALQITYAQYGVGYWTPANEFNGDTEVDDGVQRTIDVWNGTQPAGLWDPPGNNDATFTKGSGTSVPNSLPDVTDYVSRDNGSPFSVDNSSGEFSYITAKYGNEQQVVFYIAGINDEITVPLNFPGSTQNNLSHLAWLRGDARRVPEGGITALMLGLGIAGLAFARRYRS